MPDGPSVPIAQANWFLRREAARSPERPVLMATAQCPLSSAGVVNFANNCPCDVLH